MNPTPPPHLTPEALHLLLAEHLFGWRWVKGPAYDYDGPCESLDVLAPPTIPDRDLWTVCPPRGVIPRHFFVGRERWAIDLNEATRAEQHLQRTRSHLWRAYLRALSDEVGYEVGYVAELPTSASLGRLCCASAESRCRALIRTLLEAAPE